MQTVGIILLSIGVWIVYSGLYGISPVETARAIIAKPANASEIIAAARAKANEKYSELLTAAKASPLRLFGNTGLNPWALFPVSSDWEDHLKDKRGAGTDYVMPVGTPLITPKAGIVTNVANNGDGGNTVRVKFNDDGATIVLLHVSRFMKKTGDKVNALEMVALSGGAKGSVGAGSSTGPHLHVHILNASGKRIQFEKYITGSVN